MIAILGAGGHGNDIADICKRLHISYAFFDDNNDRYSLCKEAKDEFIIGVHWPHARNSFFAKMIRAGSKEYELPLVDSTATISTTAILNKCVIGPNSYIGQQSIISDQVHIGANCSITRAYIGFGTTVSPGATICGDVKIDKLVLIGAGATIINGISISNDAKIGAGAVVMKDVPEKTVVQAGEVWK